METDGSYSFHPGDLPWGEPESASGFCPIDTDHLDRERIRYFREKCLEWSRMHGRSLVTQDFLELIRVGGFRRKFQKHYATVFPEKLSKQ